MSEELTTVAAAAIEPLKIQLCAGSDSKAFPKTEMGRTPLAGPLDGKILSTTGTPYIRI
jgi:hypothetical protein